MTANQVAYWNLQEQKRANLAKENETNRSNLANEDIKRFTASQQAARWEHQNMTDSAKVNTDAVLGIAKTVGTVAIPFI